MLCLPNSCKLCVNCNSFRTIPDNTLHFRLNSCKQGTIQNCFKIHRSILLIIAYWKRYGPVSRVHLAGDCGPSFLNSIFAWFWYSTILLPSCDTKQNMISLQIFDENISNWFLVQKGWVIKFHSILFLRSSSFSCKYESLVSKTQCVQSFIQIYWLPHIASKVFS